MKLSTLYAMMLMLVRRGRMSRDELAAAFNVSGRTVQRGMEELIEAGVPVKAYPGKNGGYAIPDNYRIDVTMFSEEDLARLRVCLDALSRTFKDDLTADLIAKLAGLADGKMSSTPRLVIDSDSWGGISSQSSKLDAVSAAVAGCRTVNIEYTDKSGKSSARLLDPYTLALKEGVWYVYGWCHVHNEFRLFRLARIKTVDMTDNVFVHREGADVRGALSVDLGKRVALELRAEESALAKLEEWLGADAVSHSDGGYVCRAMVGDGDELIRRIVSFGSSVKVVSPPSVARRTLEEAERIAALYAVAPPKEEPTP